MKRKFTLPYSQSQDPMGKKHEKTGKPQSLLHNKMPYMGDNKLIPRMRRYLENKSASEPADTESIATYLQNTYHEYKRKKRNAFCVSVRRAYDILLQEYASSESDDDCDVLTPSNKQLKTIRPTGSELEKLKKDVGLEESDLTDSGIPEHKNRNVMNSMMTRLYSQTTTPSNSPSISTPQSTGFSKCSSEPVLTLLDDTFASNGVGFIDRNGRESTPVNDDTKYSLPASPRNASEMETRKPELINLVASDAEDVDGVKTPDGAANQGNRKKTNSTKIKKSTKKSKSQDSAQPKKIKDNVDAVFSTITFAQIGGNQETIKSIQHLLLHMKYPEIYQQIGIAPPRGFLLHGPPGCGKTLMANAIAGELQLPYFKLAATELVSGVSGESEERVRKLFQKAIVSAPCIVFIDEIDAITPKRETASKDMEKRIVSQLLTCLDDISSRTDANVLVIGATNRPDSLDPALRRAGRFDREITMGIPDEQARVGIMKVLCKDLKLSEDFDFGEISRLTPGYVGADLSSLVREAAMSAVNKLFASLAPEIQQNADVKAVLSFKSPNHQEQCKDMDCSIFEVSVSSEKVEEDTSDANKPTHSGTECSWWNSLPAIPPEALQSLSITMEDFKYAAKIVQPSAKREGFATVPDVTWDDVGALTSVREELQMAILAPIKYPQQFQSLGLSAPAGVLLAGPPGCGKTLLAKAIANESGINFISVKGPELINMYVGESEKAVRQVFQRARNSAPCVIFFDELDSLCPRRSLSGSDSGSGARIVNQLLTEMDGLQERKQVFVMGATNRPDIIDPAILRPGRLDKTLYIGLPNCEERIDILKTITRNCTRPYIEGVDLSELAAHPKCEGLSGADLTALVREASMAAMKEFIGSKSSNNSDQLSNTQVVVSKKHMDISVDQLKPSISAKDRMYYEKIASG